MLHNYCKEIKYALYASIKNLTKTEKIMKKFMVIILTLLTTNFVNAETMHVNTMALLVQNLNELHLNKEISATGPIASISAMTSLGYAVEKFSFLKGMISDKNQKQNKDVNSENFCTISVTMSRGAGTDPVIYNFIVLTEKGMSEETKSISFSKDYRWVSALCSVNLK